ncbi:MAG TPA: pyruvate dehydrogenase complex dihydrolipoamide acetyltransferase [Thermomicrobiales bacterium]|nr:pyruvate dehydrogenase complex dihydrolipoamide acetyltransferase [Thermomicrobiales bacterium]
MGTVIMPKMGDAMEEGTLLKWLKAAGDEVSEGDPIAEIETDKVTLEIEAQEDGFMTNLLVEEGTVAPIGTAIATIGTQDEIGQAPEGAAAAPASEEEAEAAGVAQPAAAEVPAAAATGESSPAPTREAAPATVERAPGERLRASPLVKRLAEEHGIDLGQVAGSGPGGRIIKNDINDFVTGAKPVPSAPASAAPATNGQVAAPATSAATPAAPWSGKGTKVELSRMRRTTGKRMTESKLGIPHYYVTSSVDMTAALEFRQSINATLADSGIKVSVNDLIVKAAALALREHPEVNASWEDGELYQHANVDINIAIALDGGLIAPFVPAADGKSLGAIAAMTKDLGRRAREGGLTPEEYQGGTFTISNLGMFDVDEFIAVINPPQAAILAIGSTAEVPVVKDGKIKVGNVMKITLSADHRALDGAQVATFLQSVRKYLENPMLLAVS